VGILMQVYRRAGARSETGARDLADQQLAVHRCTCVSAPVRQRRDRITDRAYKTLMVTTPGAASPHGT